MALPKLSKRSPPLRIIAVIVTCILLALAAWYFMRPQPLLVVLSKVEQGIVEAAISNTRAGTVKACRRAKLAAPSGGQISHLRVKKGERVKRGQVLLELWNEDLQAQERLTQDQLKTAIIQSRETCL